MSRRRRNIFRKRFTNEMSLQNIKEIKVGSHTKYYQKHLNLFGINLFQQYWLFWFLLLYFFSKRKTHYGVKRRRNAQQLPDVEKKTEAQRVKERSSTTAKNWNMLYTTSESTHTHKYKSSKRQKLQIKDNKLDLHSGVLCVNILGGGVLKSKFYKIKVFLI